MRLRNISGSFVWTASQEYPKFGWRCNNGGNVYQKKRLRHVGSGDTGAELRCNPRSPGLQVWPGRVTHLRRYRLLSLVMTIEPLNKRCGSNKSMWLPIQIWGRSGLHRPTDKIENTRFDHAFRDSCILMRPFTIPLQYDAKDHCRVHNWAITLVGSLDTMALA